MDHMEYIPVEMDAADGVSVGRIRAITMQKVHSNVSGRRGGKKRLTKFILLAAALVLVLSATAGAVLSWNGFSFTDGMSWAQKRALLDKVQSLTCGASIDPDGTVHYYDQDGNEVLTLSRREAAKYERERLAEAEQAVRDSTELVDLSTMPLLPAKAVEVAVGADGVVEEFALSSGSLLLFHPEGQDGYALRAGDTVTISAGANDECLVQIGCFRNSTYLTGETRKTQEHQWTYTVPEDGTYCFYLEYYSSDASLFGGCTITVKK